MVEKINVPICVDLYFKNVNCNENDKNILEIIKVFKFKTFKT